MIVGRLQGTSLIDLLEVLSSSKPSELEGGPPVFDLRLFYEEKPGAQVAVGQMVLRGPDLVSVEWGELKGLEALAALTRQQNGRCRLIRSSPADTTLKLGPRLGPVATLLAEQLAARPSEAPHPILEGVLGIEDDIGLEGFEDDISLDGRQGLEDAVSIADLFEVLGTSRQATELVISRGAAPMGWLLLQGGQLLQIRVEGTGGGETPEDKFRGLVSVQPRVDRFALYRRSETVEAQKLGPLSAFAEIARIEAHRALAPRPPSASSPPQGLSADRFSRDPDSVSLFESTADTESVSLQLPPIADPSLLVPDPPLRPSSEAQTRELPGRPMLDSDEPTRDEPTKEEMEADLFSMPLDPTPPTPPPTASSPGSTHPPTRALSPPSSESSPRASPAPLSSSTGAPAAPRESHPVPRSSPPVSRQHAPPVTRPPARPSEEDTADPPTYTPEPGTPAARPASTGPRVVQPGTRTGNTDVTAARRTHAPPSSGQREPSPTPRPVLRVRTAPAHAPEREDDPQTDRGVTPRTVSSAGSTHVAPAPLPPRASVEDQELKLAVAQLREELARQGAQLEALGKDSSMSWGMLAIGIQVFTLVLVVALLILALLPVSP